MVRQDVSAACVFVLLAGMILTAEKKAVAADAPPAARPHIVLFLVDDMGWMGSTPYGSQYYETPNMKRGHKGSFGFQYYDNVTYSKTQCCTVNKKLGIKWTIAI